MGRLDVIPGGNPSGETLGVEAERIVRIHEGATLHLVSPGEGEGDENDGKTPKASETPEASETPKAISGEPHKSETSHSEGANGYAYIDEYIQQLSTYAQGDVLSEAAWARILQTIDQVRSGGTGINMVTLGSILDRRLQEIQKIQRGSIQKGKDMLFGTSEIRNHFEELDMLLGYKILMPIILTTGEIGQMRQKAFLSLVRDAKSPVIIKLQSGRYLSIAHSANSIYMIRGLDDVNRNDFTTSSRNEVITFPEFSSIATVYIDDSGHHTYNHHVHMNDHETRLFDDKKNTFTQDVETLFREMGIVQSQDVADMGECLIDTEEVGFTHIGERSMGHNGVGNVYLAEVNYQDSRYQLELTFYRDITGRLRVYIGAFIGNGDAMTSTILSILVGETFPILKSFVGKKNISLRQLGDFFRNVRTSIQNIKLLGGIPLVVEHFRSKRDKNGNSLLIVSVQGILDALQRHNIK